MRDMRRALVTKAAILAMAAAMAADSPATATITTCGRVADSHYSFRVVAHGERAPSCPRARRVARRAVGNMIERPLAVPRWSCTADYYYEGPWSFLCIRRGTYGQVSIDRFHRRRRPARACASRSAESADPGAVVRLLARVANGLAFVAGPPARRDGT